MNLLLNKMRQARISHLRQTGALSPLRELRGVFGLALLLMLLVAADQAFAALTSFSEWQHQQRFEVSGPGLIKLSLPVGTLDAARPNLEDLRLCDAEGNEVAFAIERPRPAAKLVRTARSVQSSLAPNWTTFTVETGLNQPLAGVTLDTPANSFIKSVQVEGSSDGTEWQPIASHLPIFRQPGGAQLYVPIPPRTWRWLRFKLDDRRSPPIPLTAARVHAAEAETAPTEMVPVAIAERYENPGVTRLALRVPAANLDLQALEIQVSDPLFTRAVTLAVPEVSEDTIHERTVAQGLIYCVGVEGEAAATNLSVAVESRVRSREVVLLIHNQDSPPLAVPAVRAVGHPVYLTFYARQAGAYRLFSGNQRCPAPSYDLASLASSLKSVPLASIQISPIEPNPGQQVPEVLPGIQDGTSDLDVSEWRFRKPLKLTGSGAQQFELDLELLSHAQASLGDLRLMRGGKQVPYILQRTSISRQINPAVNASSDPKDPKLSRWSLKFERPNLPLTDLRCTAKTPLFQRDVSLYEELRDDRGDTYRRSLTSASWTRTPEIKSREFLLGLDGSSRQDTLLLETHNGDNPAIELDQFRAHYLATRVLFKAETGQDLFLYYGNQSASPPRYDLSLVAGRLLAADKSTASAGAEQQLKNAPWSETHVAGKGGWIFWGILGLVVIVLLAIISRLLPKGGNLDAPKPPSA